MHEPEVGASPPFRSEGVGRADGRGGAGQARRRGCRLRARRGRSPRRRAGPHGPAGHDRPRGRRRPRTRSPRSSERISRRLDLEDFGDRPVRAGGQLARDRAAADDAGAVPPRAGRAGEGEDDRRRSPARTCTPARSSSGPTTSVTVDGGRRPRARSLLAYGGVGAHGRGLGRRAEGDRTMNTAEMIAASRELAREKGIPFEIILEGLAGGHGVGVQGALEAGEPHGRRRLRRLPRRDRRRVRRDADVQAGPRGGRRRGRRVPRDGGPRRGRRSRSPTTSWAGSAPRPRSR